MNDIDERYTRGKIYKIVCNLTGEVYYGSTIEEIYEAVSKYKYKQEISAREIINRDNYYYELVENYSCNNTYELELKKKEYILNNKCINKNIPRRTKEETIELGNEIKKRNRIFKIVRKRLNIHIVLIKNLKQIIIQQMKKNLQKDKKKSKEYIEKYKEKTKEYYQKNKEKIKEYHQKNKEKIKEYQKIYREKNKEKAKEYQNIYRKKNLLP